MPEVDVRAFHNGRDIYFLFEWEDEAESRAHNVGEFPDAVAVAFSLAGTAPSSSIMMGFESPVNMWQWKANLDAQFWAKAVPEHVAPFGGHYTYEEKAGFPVRTTAASSACQDLIADRPGAVTFKETTDVSGRGRWRAGKWRVIITRPLSTADQERDVQLKPGPLYVAIAVWNGEKGDRGARKSISDWVVVDMKSVQGSRTVKSEMVVRPVAAADRSAGSSFSLFPAAYAQETDTAQPRVITIKAKRFEYQPSRITLQKGERVTIRLESLDVTHGFYLDGYGIQLKTNPTEVAKATFVADKTGRFTFRCSETCGEFHPYMVGFLMVEPNTRFRLFLAGTLGAGIVLAVVFSGAARKREETV